MVPLGTEVYASARPHCVRWDPNPQRKRDKFSAHVYYDETDRWIKMPLGTEVGLGPGHIVLDGELGTQLALSLKGHSPQFSAHVSCGQTAGWIKMLLGGKVALDPGNTVLDGNPAPLPHRGTPAQLSAYVCCGQTAGWIKLPPGTEIDVFPGHIVLDFLFEVGYVMLQAESEVKYWT